MLAKINANAARLGEVEARLYARIDRSDSPAIVAATETKTLKHHFGTATTIIGGGFALIHWVLPWLDRLR